MLVKYFFLCGATAQNGFSLSHTIRHTHTHTHTRAVGMSDQRFAEAATCTKTNTRTNICALCETRTRDPGNQVAAEPRLTPHGHRDQPVKKITGPHSTIHFDGYL